MGDLTKRRGRILGMNAVHGGKQLIEAELPMSNLYLYNTDLRSMTGGSGSFSFEFDRYEQAPGDIQNIVIQERRIERRQKSKRIDKYFLKAKSDEIRNFLVAFFIPFYSDCCPPNYCNFCLFKSTVHAITAKQNTRIKYHRFSR